MTQNVFGNNSRRKLEFKIGVVGEAFNQVRVNGLPAKFQLFNQEGWSRKWPWPIHVYVFSRPEFKQEIDVHVNGLPAKIKLFNQEG